MFRMVPLTKAHVFVYGCYRKMGSCGSGGDGPWFDPLQTAYQSVLGKDIGPQIALDKTLNCSRCVTAFEWENMKMFSSMSYVFIVLYKPGVTLNNNPRSSLGFQAALKRVPCWGLQYLCSVRVRLVLAAEQKSSLEPFISIFQYLSVLLLTSITAWNVS